VVAGEGEAGTEGGAAGVFGDDHGVEVRGVRLGDIGRVDAVELELGAVDGPAGLVEDIEVRERAGDAHDGGGGRRRGGEGEGGEGGGGERGAGDAEGPAGGADDTGHGASLGMS